MNRFAIFVTVKLHPGGADQFRPLILANAKSAVRDEPDCHLFHVLHSEDEPDTFHFYEVYTNAQALETHREQPHFIKYTELATPLIAERQIQRVGVLNPENIA